MSSSHHHLSSSHLLPVTTIMSGTGGDNHHMPMMVDEQQMQHVVVHNNSSNNTNPKSNINNNNNNNNNDRQPSTTPSQTSIESQSNVQSMTAVETTMPAQQQTVISQHHQPQRPASTGSEHHFRSLIEQHQQQQSLIQPHQVVYSLADHVDDDNDLFECGKCKQHFSYLHGFLQHKNLCNSRKNSLNNIEKYGELAEIELHLGIANTSPQQQHSIQHAQLSHHPHHHHPHHAHAHAQQQQQQQHHSLGKTLLSSSANSSPLLIQSTNNSPTSMLNVGHQQTNSLVVDFNNQRLNHIHHQNRSSPLVDPLNGSSMINVNSILPDNDLLSLTSSLDPNMIASIGNSISPSSLLHLQGGDVSSNTDDFAQFAHINHMDSSNEVVLNDIHSVQSRTTSATSLFLNGNGNLSSNNNNNNTSTSHSMLNSLVVSSISTPSISSTSSTISVGTQHHHHHQSQQQQQAQPSINVINFMNTLNTSSPTAFTSFIHNLSSTDVIDGEEVDDVIRKGITGTLLTSSNTKEAKNTSSTTVTTFDGGDNIDETSNDNSIGSPSRFLNLASGPPLATSSSIHHPVTSSGPPTPSSIIEHRPNQTSSLVRSTQTPMTKLVPLSSIAADTNNHHQQQQQQQQQQKQKQKQKEKTTTNLNAMHHSEQPKGTILIDKLINQDQVNHHSETISETTATISATTTHTQAPTTCTEIFNCEFCARSFGKMSELTNHLPCHTGEKPFQCGLCGKAFGHKNNLRKHIITHKRSKEETKSLYKNSVAESTKNMSKSDIKSLKKVKKSQPIKPPEVVTETIVYLCPMKCGATAGSLESLKIHCANEHQTTFVESVADAANLTVLTDTTINGDQQQQQQKLQPVQIDDQTASMGFIHISQISGETTPPNKKKSRKKLMKKPKKPRCIKSKPKPPSVTIPKAVTNKQDEERNIHQNHPATTPLPPGKAGRPKKQKIETKLESLDEQKKEESVNYSVDQSQQSASQTATLPVPFKLQDQFLCPAPECGFVSTKETEFKMHCVDHKVANDENIRYRCTSNDCQEVYNNIEAYIKHLQSHDRALCNSEQSCSNGTKHKSRIYRCATCLNRYSTQNALENHKATTSHHYPCQNCTKVFPCERYLRRHLLTHGAGLFMCQYCDKSFKTANYLKVHLIIHTGEKPFACKICDAAFNRRDKLKRHQLVHDPVKRYKCPMNNNGCKREFNRPDKLKAHILTHSGVKPYQCPMCVRSFTRRAHLREHSKTHSEIPPFDTANQENVAKSEDRQVVVVKVENEKIQAQSIANTSNENTIDQAKTKDNLLIMEENRDTLRGSSETDKDNQGDKQRVFKSVTTFANFINRTKTNNNSKRLDEIQPKLVGGHAAIKLEQKRNSSRIVVENKSKQDDHAQKAPNIKKNQMLRGIMGTINPKDQNNGSIILITNASMPRPPLTTAGNPGQVLQEQSRSNVSSTNTIHLLPSHHQQTAVTVQLNRQPLISSSSSSSSAAAAAAASTTTTTTTTTTTSTNSTIINSIGAIGGDNPNTFQTFILLYTCPKCDSCFLKEDEIKNHLCLAANNRQHHHHHPNDNNPKTKTAAAILNKISNNSNNNNSNNNNPETIVNSMDDNRPQATQQQILLSMTNTNAAGSIVSNLNQQQRSLVTVPVVDH